MSYDMNRITQKVGASILGAPAFLYITLYIAEVILHDLKRSQTLLHQRFH